MKTYLVIATLIIANNLQAQDFQVEYRFNNTSTYNFEISHTKSSSSNPLSKEVMIKTPAEATFSLEIDELLCTWKEGESEIVASKEILDQIDTDSYQDTKVTNGLTLEYIIDYRLGQVIIENVENLKSSIRKQSASVYKGSSSSEDMLDSTLQSDEIIMGVYYPGLSHYLSFIGHTVNLTSTIEKEIAFPNILTGGNMPAVRKTYVHEKKGDLLIIHAKDIVDIKAFRAAFLKVISQGPGADEDPELLAKEVESTNLDVGYEYHYNSKLKLMERVIYTKEIEMMGESQLDRIEIKIVKAP